MASAKWPKAKAPRDAGLSFLQIERLLTGGSP
jgi:hypothetical protein